MKWISVKDRLPKDKQYVLAIHNRGTWIDEDDPFKVNYVVVKFMKGLTFEEATKRGVYTWRDEYGNNQRPYCWDCFGPDCFFGQSIDYWMPLPPPPKGT